MRLPTRTSLSLAALLVLAACGGGDSGAGGGGNDADDAGGTEAVAPDGATTDAADEVDDGGNDGADGTAPVEGAVVSLLSPDLGLYSVDRDSGEHRALILDGVGYVDRDMQPIAATTSAFTVSLTTLEGESYAHDLGVVRIDLDSGDAVELIELGVDRESDESEDLTVWEVLDADDTTVWLETSAFTGEGTSIVGFDATTGDNTATFDDLDFEIVTDEGSTCSGTAEGLLVMPGGELITTTSGWPAELDPATGGIEMVFDWCGFGVELTLADFVDSADAVEWFVTEDGSAVSAEAAEAVLPFVPLRAAPSGGRGLAEGDGSIWWLFVSGTTIPDGEENVSAYTGGVVRFDPAAGKVVDVWPLGNAAATYLHDEDESDDGMTTVSTMSSFDLRYLDGALWIMDHRDDAPLRRLDPVTGEISELTIEKGDGIDLTAAEMIFSDPEAIWLDVVRKVITQDDESGRSTSGTSFVESVDPSTGTIVVSVAVADILGF
jgi:hypothetical protein